MDIKSYAANVCTEILVQYFYSIVTKVKNKIIAQEKIYSEKRLDQINTFIMDNLIVRFQYRQIKHCKILSMVKCNFLLLYIS